MQNTPQQMQAMAVNEFGGTDKLTLHTLPVPTVDAGEVLIRIETAGVGIWETMEREGDLVYNEVHFPRVLGGECAGTIVAVGESIERFAVGDRVYAQTFMNDKGGSYAEYVVVSEETIAPMPASLDIVMAGGLPIAGITALNNLQALGIGSKTKLMLWGASGGVGHVALQLAKRMGASVFAIEGFSGCSENCLDYFACLTLTSPRQLQTLPPPNFVRFASINRQPKVRYGGEAKVIVVTRSPNSQNQDLVIPFTGKKTI